MTAISFNGKWASAAIAGLNLQLASLNQPARFGNASSGPTAEPNMQNLPDGYVTWSNINANEYVSLLNRLLVDLRWGKILI